MNKSESIVKLSLALVKAQRNIGAATKGSKNPFFKSKFADYGSVLEAIKEPLNNEGVSILQPTTYQEGKTFVETMLLHESGEWISSLTEVVCAKQNDPQAFGAAITYAKRYGLQSLTSLPSEDDDGESAMVRPTNLSETKTEAKENPWRKVKPESKVTKTTDEPKVVGLSF